METLTPEKKAMININNLEVDWPTPWIKFKLETQGKTSIRKLSIANNYSPDSLKKVLRAPWPDAELIIANAIGVEPQKIWPTRYNLDGTPKKGICKKSNFQDISTFNARSTK